MEVLFLQTADVAVYAPLLAESARTVRAYCARHGCAYHTFTGILRGCSPWHAALNRIPLLRAIAGMGFAGWVVYLDADAYIHDLSFDVREFLAGHAEGALVAAASGVVPPHWWDINDGVFAINLGHAGGRAVIEAWGARLDDIPEDRLRGELNWGEVADDQAMLHAVLRELPGAEAWVRIDQAYTLNYAARFIRQVLRAEYAGLAARLAKLRYAVARVVADEGDGAASAGESVGGFLYDELVRALYRTLLGREPDAGGFRDAVAAMRSGRQTMEGQILATLACEEFRQRLPEFVAARGMPTEIGNRVAHASRGFVDYVDGGRVEGWADGGDRPAIISVDVDGVRVANVTADIYRADVERAGIGDGRRGFVYHFVPPLDPEMAHLIEVRNVTAGNEIKGSPIRISRGGVPVRPASGFLR